MTNHTSQECKGCFLYNACKIGTRYGKSMLLQCPCLICLVKSVCNTSCDAYSDYDYKLDLLEREMNNGKR